MTSILMDYLEFYTSLNIYIMKTNKREFFSSDRKRKRKHHTNRHHLVNRCMGGNSSKNNILIIDIDRHHAWHELFRNLDLDQVIALLLRVKRAKFNQI